MVAYMAPGFVCLAGASRFSGLVAGWMEVDPTGTLTVGSFLYVIVGSLAAGLVVNAFRWALLDGLFHRTGLTPPRLNFAQLQAHLEAFQLAVEHNYRYYQFYAGTVLASAFYSAADQAARGPWPWWQLAGLAVTEVVLLATARDCLRRFYERTSQMLGLEDARGP